MTQINVKRLVNNIAQTNIYTPVVEAIVNAIDAVEESKKQNGKIEISLIRSGQANLQSNPDETPPVISIKIKDNGVGFTDDNFQAFDRIYTDRKIKRGGKGFGRLVYLKYFQNISVKSIYKKNDDYYSRSFDFVSEDQMTQNHTNEKVESKDVYSEITLGNIENYHLGKMDKKIETIARKLLDNLLVYFALDNYMCPEISVIDTDSNQTIILNRYFGDKNGILEIYKKDFELVSTDGKEKFNAKVFKVYFGEGKSTINLVADNRLVTEQSIYNYIPEFKDNFYDKFLNDKKEEVNKNYVIKVYVTGTYLNKHVQSERGSFKFQDKKDLLYSFSREDIEKRAAFITQEALPDEILTRQKKKEKNIREYVNNEAPWHKPFFNDLDMSIVPYSFTEEEIEIELQKTKYKKEHSAITAIREVLKQDKIELNSQVLTIVSTITDAGKSDLAHYVSSRKVVLDMFKKLLERDDDGSTKLEVDIHNIIFPMGKTSQDINYEDHNLWLLDERLVFTEFVASDKKISKTEAKGEPDLLIFHNAVAYRSGENEFSNPLIIFEFKRPKRTEYSDSEDPIIQVSKYLKAIRAGKYETPKGLEKIKVNEFTPVYGYIVCDLTDKIREFATNHQLVPSPDKEGYFGFHSGFGMYIEIYSFKKLLKDANIRNKIFFKKLGIV